MAEPTSSDAIADAVESSQPLQLHESPYDVLIKSVKEYVASTSLLPDAEMTEPADAAMELERTEIAESIESTAEPAADAEPSESLEPIELLELADDLDLAEIIDQVDTSITTKMPSAGRVADKDPMVLSKETICIPNSLFTLPFILDQTTEPNFTLRQLIILALVSSTNRILSLNEICAWISDRFGYYKDLTFLRARDQQNGPCEWMEVVEQTLHEYDFPTSPICDDDGNGEMHFHLEQGQEWFILPTPDKMISKPFPLFKLPYQLRLIIYAFTLCHPLPTKKGWVIDPEYTRTRKIEYLKAGHEPQYLTTIHQPGNWELRTRRLDKVLALTQANKQLQKEATPVFYRTNTFYFDSANILNGFLNGIPMRKKFIRNIILNYDPPATNHRCTRTFELLAETKLRNIHIIANEKEILHRLLGYGKIENIPGIKALAKLRGLDNVTFDGECPGIIRYLKDKKITNLKLNDSQDSDENAEEALEQEKVDRKNYFKKVMKRAIKDGQNRRKQEAETAKKEVAAEVREEKRLERDEAKTAKEAEAKKKRKAVLAKTSAARKEKENLEAKAKAKQKAERAKVQKLKVEAKRAAKEKRETEKATKSKTKEKTSPGAGAGSKRKKVEVSSDRIEYENESDDASSDSSSDEGSEEEAKAPPPKKQKTAAAPAKSKGPKSAVRKIIASSKRPKPILFKGSTITTAGREPKKCTGSAKKKALPHQYNYKPAKVSDADDEDSDDEL